MPERRDLIDADRCRIPADGSPRRRRCADGPCRERPRARPHRRPRPRARRHAVPAARGRPVPRGGGAARMRRARQARPRRALPRLGRAAGQHRIRRPAPGQLRIARPRTAMPHPQTVRAGRPRARRRRECCAALAAGAALREARPRVPARMVERRDHRALHGSRGATPPRRPIRISAPRSRSIPAAGSRGRPGGARACRP